MKILALEKDVPGVTEEAFKPYQAEEAARVWELYQAGVLRELYFRQDEPCAVLALECEGAEEAKGFLDTLPLVREGLIAFDVIPLVAYPGFARLFADKSTERL
jgi:muconolactone delta-isomerase